MVIIIAIMLAKICVVIFDKYMNFIDEWLYLQNRHAYYLNVA